MSSTNTTLASSLRQPATLNSSMNRVSLLLGASKPGLKTGGAVLCKPWLGSQLPAAVKPLRATGWDPSQTVRSGPACSGKVSWITMWRLSMVRQEPAP